MFAKAEAILSRKSGLSWFYEQNFAYFKNRSRLVHHETRKMSCQQNDRFSKWNYLEWKGKNQLHFLTLILYRAESGVSSAFMDCFVLFWSSNCTYKRKVCRIFKCSCNPRPLPVRGWLNVTMREGGCSRCLTLTLRCIWAFACSSARFRVFNFFSSVC